jgi:hypothetical protein
MYSIIINSNYGNDIISLFIQRSADTSCTSVLISRLPAVQWSHRTSSESAAAAIGRGAVKDNANTKPHLFQTAGMSSISHHALIQVATGYADVYAFIQTPPFSLSRSYDGISTHQTHPSAHSASPQQRTSSAVLWTLCC